MPSKGQENFPDGEVFTAPVESSVEGEIRFTYPASSTRARSNDVRLRFEGGEVVEATATRGRGVPARDDRDGRRAPGGSASSRSASTRPCRRFTRNTLFDEKIGGTVHLALGTAYPETGGLNRSGAALGSDLRPPFGQRGLRGRRARLSRRAVSQRVELSRWFCARARICRCDGREARAGRSGEGLESRGAEGGATPPA